MGLVMLSALSLSVYMAVWCSEKVFMFQSTRTMVVHNPMQQEQPNKNLQKQWECVSESERTRDERGCEFCLFIYNFQVLIHHKRFGLFDARDYCCICRHFSLSFFSVNCSEVEEGGGGWQRWRRREKEIHSFTRKSDLFSFFFCSFGIFFL